jgi:hypothetical protein
MRLGLRVGPHSAIALRAGALLQPQRSAPLSVNYHSRITFDGDAIGNDNAGNCWEADTLRRAQLRMAWAWGSSWKPTTALALELYAQITGFDVTTGQPDIGTLPAEGQAWVAANGVNVGLQDPDAELPVSLNHTREDLLSWATDEFCGIGLEFDLPLAWQDVVAKGGTVLDVPAAGVSSPGGQPGSWGRHQVGSGRYDPQRRYIISWGLELTVTPAAMTAYCVGASAAMARSWLETTGKTPLGLSWDDATAALRGAAS